MIRLFTLVALAYVAARFVIVLALGDVFVYGEEHEKAYVGQLVLGGADVPYARLPYHPYEGGGFVASHVKLPFFGLFGVTPLAHKAAAILWGVLTVWASMALAATHGRVTGRGGEPEVEGGARAGQGSALFLGLALTLAPVFMVKGSLVHLGIHYEALLFIALTLHLGLVCMATPAEEKVPARTLAALGLAAGFGSYFSYQVPLAVLTVICGIAVRRWQTIFHPVLMLSTVVGLAPWLWMWSQVGPEVLDLHGEKVAQEGAWLRFLQALEACLDQPFMGASLALVGLAIIAGWAFRLPRGPRLTAILLIGGFADLWFLVGGATGMLHAPADPENWFPFLRLVPLAWAVLAVTALSVGPALAAVGDQRSRVPARITRLAAAMVLGLGGVQLARMVDEGELSEASQNWRVITTVRASEPRNALIKIVPRLFADEGLPEPGDGDEAAPEKIDAEAFAAVVAPLLRVAAESDHPYERAFLIRETVEGAVHSMRTHLVPDPDAVERALIEAAPDAPWGEDERRAVALGLGALHELALGSAADLPGALAKLAAANPDDAELTAEALGRYRYWPGMRGSDVGPELQLVRGAPLAEFYLRGLGARALRSGVMQPYFGKEALFRPPVVARQLLNEAAEAELSEAETDGLFMGFTAESSAFGFRPVALPY